MNELLLFVILCFEDIALMAVVAHMCG